MAAVFLVLTIGLIFVGTATIAAFRARKEAGGRKWLETAGFALVAFGGFGFFGSAFSAVGGLRWLPPNFEWPVGSARNVLVMPDGRRVVPHTPTGRIQIYDSNWNFVRGWWVDAGGGTFFIRRANANRIEVITARRNLRYVCELDGHLISEQTYAPERYSDFGLPPGQSAVVPTRWWLWTFTSPFYSWLAGALGMALLIISNRRKAKRKQAECI